jgi:hypothetical protein
MLIFIDETGSDAKNKLRKYGYSIKGSPAKNQTFLVRGERISTITCMSISRLVDVKTIHGTAKLSGEVSDSCISYLTVESIHIL